MMPSAPPPLSPPLWGADNVELDDADEVAKAIRAASPAQRELNYTVRNVHLLTDRRALYGFVQRLRSDGRFAGCEFELAYQCTDTIKILNTRAFASENAGGEYDISLVRDAEFLVGHTAPLGRKNAFFVWLLAALLTLMGCAMAMTVIVAGEANEYINSCTMSLQNNITNWTSAGKTTQMDRVAALFHLNGPSCDLQTRFTYNLIPYGIISILFVAIVVLLRKLTDDAQQHNVPLPTKHHIAWAHATIEEFV